MLLVNIHSAGILKDYLPSIIIDWCSYLSRSCEEDSLPKQFISMYVEQFLYVCKPCALANYYHVHVSDSDLVWSYSSSSLLSKCSKPTASQFELQYLLLFTHFSPINIAARKITISTKQCQEKAIGTNIAAADDFSDHFLGPYIMKAIW